ncbi:MAG: haloacid dehalogenase type II [Pseudomonadota bacterium]
MSSETLAFDVYGTLIDPHAIVVRLEGYLGDRAIRFSQIWRSKQLEYSFRRGLMGAYEDFSVVTRDALGYTNKLLETELSNKVQEHLLDDYTRLSAYDDVPDALTKLRVEGRALYAFSNGHPRDLQSLLDHAGLTDLLDGIVSVDDVASFKPDARVYKHFNKLTNTQPSRTRLVSSNAFDIAGAQACGWNATWLQRDESLVFDSWGELPNTIVISLSSL